MRLHLEPDDELRRRVRYVGGDGEVAQRRIEMAGGSALEAIADTFKLRRRRSGDAE